MWLAGFPARSRCRHRLQARFTRQDGRLRGRARRGQKIRYDAGHLVLLRLGITLCGGVDFEEAIDVTGTYPPRRALAHIAFPVSEL